MTDPTHARIDNDTHAITAIEAMGDRERVRFGCGILIDTQGANWRDEERWHDETEATCPGCVDVETHGEAPHVPGSEAKSITIKGDIPVGLNCHEPGCGAPLFAKRDSGLVVCSAQGHEFAMPEVLAVSMSLIQRLAKGEI